MVRLAGTFSRLGPCKVMVIGDLLLDTYTVGKARRISPEAPVAVVQVIHEEHRPGGSGNVVLNLLSLGAQVVTIGRIGADSAGQLLTQALQSEGASIDGIVIQESFKTPVKNRVIAENQQIVRVDYETVTLIPEMLEQQVIESLPKMMQGVQVVAISDYGKGFLTQTLLRAVIDCAKERNIPVITDPKGVDFSKYSGSTVIKPNLSEAIAASGLPPESPLENICAKVLGQVQAEVLMVTRSEAGISLFHKDGQRQDFPVHVREVKDVTGAGDTVLAMLTAALANGLTIGEAAQLSNVAAGIAIERFGCARISLTDLARRLLEFDVINKVFDEEHLFALQEALRGKNFALLGVHGNKGLSSRLYRTIHELAQRPDWNLLVYIRDHAPTEEFVNILASLREVNFIIVNAASLRSLCRLIEPNEVHLFDQDESRRVDHTEVILAGK